MRQNHQKVNERDIGEMEVILKKGYRVGTFVIVDPLKRGGMAQIYRARSTNSRTEVAIKVSLANGGDPQNKNALRQEVDILSKFNHPGVIRLVPIQLSGSKNPPLMARLIHLPGQPWYYMMEYLPGGSLAGALKKIKRFPFTLAAVIGSKLANTLIYIHSIGIAHLDIKPENILLRHSLKHNNPIEPVLIDFGVAANTKDPKASGGTLVTMAPEYIRKLRGELAPAHVVDLRMVDTYSLGVVMYRLWTGNYPFDSISERNITSKILLEKPKPPSDVNPELPRQVDDLMVNWLAKDPFIRPSLDEIENTLRYMSAGLKYVPRGLDGSEKSNSSWKFWKK